MQQFNQKVRVGHVTKAPLYLLLLGAFILTALTIYIANSRADENHDLSANQEQDNSFKTNAQNNIVSYLEKLAQDNLMLDHNKDTLKSDHYYIDMYESQYENTPMTNSSNTSSWNSNLNSTPNSPSYKEQLQANLANARAQALIQALSAQTSVAQTNNIKMTALNKEQDKSNDKLVLENIENKSYVQNYLNQAANKLERLNQGSPSSLSLAPNNKPLFDANTHQTLSAYQALVNSDTTMIGEVQEVLSPYLVRQGAVIPCTLLTGINSDLPGLVQAQVSQDVYDSPQGHYILIPKGSKVIGQYSSSPMMGQERLMMAFNKVIFPNGKAVDLGAMVGSSLDGYSGFNADVDNHFLRTLSNAVLLGGVTAAISLSVDDKRDDNGDLTLNGALSQSLGQSVGRVLTNIIERNLNTAPTLKVKPGYSFNVTLIKDIYFSTPYQSN